MNIKKFQLFNRVLIKQLDEELIAFLNKDNEKEEQSRLDSLKTIDILKDMIDEDLNNTSQNVYEQASLIFK